MPTVERERLYTPFPNPALDYVMAILEPTEWVCISYIVRRTRGFHDVGGERKRMDVISLDQFERGISRSDGRILDLGTGLSRSAIRNALEGLERKELIVSRLACTRCYWLQAEGEPDPPAVGRAKSPCCPICKRSLSRSYGLAQLSAKRLEQILNRYDPKGRSFSWDPDLVDYVVDVPEAEERRTRREQDLRAEALRLRSLLWYPDLVDQAAKMAEGALKAGGKLSLRRRISGFYQPVLELQETYVSAPLVRYALEETLRRKVPAGRRNRNWHHYTRAICENNRTNPRFAGVPVATDTNAALARKRSLPAREQAVRELLKRAAQLNGAGELEAGRALLSDILAHARDLAELFGGDVKVADCALREAFKQGVSDFSSIDPADSLGLDFYEEWTWPDGVPTPAQLRRRERTGGGRR
jgi:hypothetical protein